MDIQKEIEKFRHLGYETLSNELNQLEEEIKLKKYLFKVLHHLNEFEKLIKENIFEPKGIYYMRLTQSTDYDIGEVFSKLEILNENKEQLNIYSYGNHIPEYKSLHELFSHNYFKLEDNLFNEQIEKQILVVKLDEHAKERMKNYLLNYDLRKAYDYVEMLNKIPPKEQTQIKKKKI